MSSGKKELGMEHQAHLPSRPSDVEVSYFELQAYTGATKHGGGLDTTRELVRQCHIGPDSYVLDVGCGAGATPSYLARDVGCRVVAVDLREGMIARARERARRERVEEGIEFRVADARDLPFENCLFDAVLCESVATFVEEKQQVVHELVRVLKPGGYVGLNEEIWIETPPASLAKEVKHIFSVEPDVPTEGDWRAMLEQAGLQDLVVMRRKFTTRGESAQLKRYRLQDMAALLYRTLGLYLRNPAFRDYMRERHQLPEDVFRYFGYGLFVGRK
jgi:ubiquinone/menaquinone biosynthesis C-methylase UbiE